MLDGNGTSTKPLTYEDWFSTISCVVDICVPHTMFDAAFAFAGGAY